MRTLWKRHKKVILIGGSVFIAVSGLYLWYKYYKNMSDEFDQKFGDIQRDSNAIMEDTENNSISMRRNGETNESHALNTSSNRTTQSADRLNDSTVKTDRQIILELIENAKIFTLCQQTAQAQMTMSEMQQQLPYSVAFDIYLCQQFCDQLPVDHNVLYELASNEYEKSIADYYQHLSIQRYENAKKFLDNAIKKFPGSSELLLLRIQFNVSLFPLDVPLNLRNQQEALDDCKILIMSSKSKPSQIAYASYLISEMYQDLYEIGQKLYYLNFALRHVPDYVDCLLQKSNILIQVGKIDEGLEAAKKILKMNPRNEEALSLIAFGMFYSDQVEQSATILRDILKHDPKANVYNQLASCYSVLYKDLTKILEVLSVAMENRVEEKANYMLSRAFYHLIYSDIGECIKICDDDEMFKSYSQIIPKSLSPKNNTTTFSNYHSNTNATKKLSGNIRDVTNERKELSEIAKRIKSFSIKYHIKFQCGQLLEIGENILSSLQLNAIDSSNISESANKDWESLVDFVLLVIFAERQSEANFPEYSKEVKAVLQSKQNGVLKVISTNGLILYHIIQQYFEDGGVFQSDLIETMKKISQMHEPERAIQECLELISKMQIL